MAALVALVLPDLVTPEAPQPRLETVAAVAVVVVVPLGVTRQAQLAALAARVPLIL